MEDVLINLPEADGLGGSQTRWRLQTRKQIKRGDGFGQDREEKKWVEVAHMIFTDSCQTWFLCSWLCLPSLSSGQVGHQHSPLVDTPLLFKHTVFSTPSLSPNPQLPISLVYFLNTIIEARVTTNLWLRFSGEGTLFCHLICWRE